MVRLFTALVWTLFLPLASAAQGTVEFNLFKIEGAYVNKVFTFDEGYAQKFGIPVPAAFGVEVPQHGDVHLIADGKPDSGFVKFTFATKGEPRVFIENFHVVDMSVGMAADQPDPAAARVATLDKLMRERAMPMATQGFADLKFVGGREIEVNGAAAIQMVVTHTDAQWGPMAMEVVGILNPKAPESYLVLHNISLARVPLSDPDMLPQTLGGRVLASFTCK